MFANTLVLLIHCTGRLRSILGCEARCSGCPFRKMEKDCPGRVLQDFIDQERKRINED